MSYKITKTQFGSKVFYHRIECIGGGYAYFWSTEEKGCLWVKSREEGKKYIKDFDPNTSIKELNFQKV